MTTVRKSSTTMIAAPPEEVWAQLDPRDPCGAEWERPRGPHL